MRCSFLCCKIWFFDSCRSWFFDFCRPSRQIEAQIQRNFKRKLRASSNYLKIVFTIIKIISGALCDTADNKRLEAKCSVKSSSNSVCKFETLDSLDVASISISVTVYNIISLDKNKVDLDFRSCKEFNPIVTS